MARKPINIVAPKGSFELPGVMTQEQLERKIQEMEQKINPSKKPRKPKPLPQASPELWPGGPSTDTGDIELA